MIFSSIDELIPFVVHFNVVFYAKRLGAGADISNSMFYLPCQLLR